MSSDIGERRLLPVYLVLSAAAMVGIALQEGYTETAQPPIKGDKPTNGFGSTGPDIKLGDKTTPPKALQRMLRDVQANESAMRGCVKAPLTQYEYDAYNSLAYNIGTGAFCSSTLVKKANAGNYAGACEEFLRWRYYQGHDCSLPQWKSLCGGIWNRRQWEYRLCLGEIK